MKTISKVMYGAILLAGVALAAGGCMDTLDMLTCTPRTETARIEELETRMDALEWERDRARVPYNIEHMGDLWRPSEPEP